MAHRDRNPQNADYLRYIDVIPIFGNGTTVPASSTYYMQVGLTGVISAVANFPWPVGGVLRNLTFRTSGTQPGTGSLVVTIQNAGVNTAVTITVPANGTSGNYVSTGEAIVLPGFLFKVELVNNATSASATIAGLTTQLISRLVA